MAFNYRGRAMNVQRCLDDKSTVPQNLLMDELHKLRAICIDLPEVSERLSHGEPAWFLREKKLFAMFADHHHDDRLAFWCAAAEGVQEMLVQADPTTFFRPPYVGARGWVGVYLDVPVDWNMIEGIICDAHSCVSRRRNA
jgi:hypothetical protein